MTTEKVAPKVAIKKALKPNDFKAFRIWCAIRDSNPGHPD